MFQYFQEFIFYFRTLDMENQNLQCNMSMFEETICVKDEVHNYTPTQAADIAVTKQHNINDINW